VRTLIEYEEVKEEDEAGSGESKMETVPSIEPVANL